MNLTGFIPTCMKRLHSRASNFEFAATNEPKFQNHLTAEKGGKERQNMIIELRSDV
jgi:hypothetical protein